MDGSCENCLSVLLPLEFAPNHNSHPHQSHSGQAQSARFRSGDGGSTAGKRDLPAVVLGQGRPHLANRAALAILEKRDGISMARGEIVADRASDTYLLHKLLHDAITSPASGEQKDSPMMLRRETAQTPLVVRVVPGPELHSWPGTTGRTALLKLYDQDMGMVVDEGALSRIYGLTRGEAALARHLIQGISLEEAAEKLFISPHTARTHLKRIFMKTDTHRQPEFLVRMLLTVL